MKIKLALAQYPLTRFKNLNEWKEHVEGWVLKAVSEKSQILVFPEYGSMEIVTLSKKMENGVLELKDQIIEMNYFLNDYLLTFKELARKHQVFVLPPTFPVIEKNRVINRAYFFSPSGEFGYQDKLTMTRFEDETWGVESPETVQLTVFETVFGSIGINICFDSEFPQFAYELAQEGVQLLLAPSCTESLSGLNRVHIGCRARALENQIYVATCSTVGEATWSQAVDKNTGRAAVFSTPDLGFPEDGICQIGQLNQPGWVFAEVDLSKIDKVRSEGHVFNFKKINLSMNRNSKIKIVRCQL